MPEDLTGSPPSSAGVTPFAGVPSDTLSLIQSQRAGGSDDVEIEVDDLASGTDAGTSPAASDIDNRFRELEARLAETARNNAVLEERLRHTQAWGQTRNQEATVAQQMIQASREERERYAWEEQQRRSMTPPEWTPEEVDSIGGVLDPDLLRRKMQEHATWGARQALMEIAPHVHHLGQIAQQVPVINQIQAAIVRGNQKSALNEAVRAVAARGELDQETIQSLVPRVYEMFNTQGPAAAIDLSLQPDSIAAGIELIHRYQTGGVAPVKVKAKAPRSLGAGNTSTSSKITVSREVLDEIRRVEAKTGQKFTADEIKSFATGRVA